MCALRTLANIPLFFFMKPWCNDFCYDLGGMCIGFCCRITKSASGKKKAVARKWDWLLRLIGGNNRYHFPGKFVNNSIFLHFLSIFLRFYSSVQVLSHVCVLTTLNATSCHNHPSLIPNLRLLFHLLTNFLFSSKSFMRVLLSHSMVVHVTAIALIPAVMRVCVVFTEAATAAPVQKLQLVSSTFSFFLSFFIFGEFCCCF